MYYSRIEIFSQKSKNGRFVRFLFAKTEMMITFAVQFFKCLTYKADIGIKADFGILNFKSLNFKSLNL